ncbi:MAG: PDZ domain-containing protein [Candidatus Pristimantibacillus sp.]
MERWFRYYCSGIAIMLFMIVFAEVIWLPAPLRLSSGRLWIEMIDGLLYALILIPLMWGLGAWNGIIVQRTKAKQEARRGSLLLLLLRYLIIAISAGAIIHMLWAPDSLVMEIGLLIIGLVLIFVDMLWSEVNSNLIKSSEIRSRLPKRSLLVLLLTSVLLAVLVSPTAYRVTYPAMTMEMNRYAHAEGGTAQGRISGVLVFERPAFPADWLYAQLLPEYEFERKPENEQPLTEAYTEVVTMKTGANSIASAIAMKKAGIGKGVTANGVVVLQVAEGSAAQSFLLAGDVIIGLNNQDVASVDEMTAIMIKQVTPGEEVDVTLIRKGAKMSIKVPTRAAEATETLPARAVFGVSVDNELHADIPRDVQYRHYIAHIGGPSHGAMLTLALLDQLTPGGVTNGVRVAGTGTIEADGSIGMVGGIPQKAYAVSRTDADVFFVPAKSLEEAQAAAPDLLIVPVKTIDEVIGWLKQQHPK